MEKNTRAKARDMKVADDEKRGEISFSPSRRKEARKLFLPTFVGRFVEGM